MDQETDHSEQSGQTAKGRTMVKMIVAEPCYITDTERHLHKLNTALRNLYYATEQLCFEAEHSVIGADLFVEMTLCSEQTATLTESFPRTLLMW